MDIKIGIYRGMSFAEYCAIPAVNQSTLKEPTPAHYRYRVEHPQKQTAAMITGQAVHTALTDGIEAFKALYIMGGPVNDKTGRVYGRDSQRFQDWLSAQPADKEYLTTEEWDTVCGIIQSLDEYPVIKSYIMDGSPDDNELTLVWRDEESGLLCKARLDLFRAGRESIGDIKTSEDASQDGFQASLANYDYFRQGAFYVDGAKSCGLRDNQGRDITSFIFLCVEKTPPYAWAMYRLDDNDLALGRALNRADLLRIAECRRTGIWPGYPSTREVIDYWTGEVKKEFIPIQLPAWKRRRLTEGSGI